MFIFLVNRITFPEFPQFLSKQFLIFNSTLVVNYPNQASFERNWMFFTAFFYVHIGLFQLALRAIWNNLSKKHFSNNAQRRHVGEL